MKPTSCNYRPDLVNGPLGMFHCPECGEMQIAGFKHTDIMEDSDWDKIDGNFVDNEQNK